jgi:hypothetical protein
LPRVRILLIAVVTALVSMWIYVLYLAFVPGRQPPIDRLDNPAFAEAAQARCHKAVRKVAKLPNATQSKTPDDRADVVDKANGTFAVMLSDLDGLARMAPAGAQRHRTREWLADWQTMLHDREEYAAALRKDPHARMLFSPKPGTNQQLTDWIDEFAKANDMPDCVTPLEV